MTVTELLTVISSGGSEIVGIVSPKTTIEFKKTKQTNNKYIISRKTLISKAPKKILSRKGHITIII